MPVKSILLLSVMATLGSFVAAFGCGDGLTAYCGHKQGAACVLELFSDQIGGSCSPDVEQQRCCNTDSLHLVGHRVGCPQFDACKAPTSS
ncbi:hypothetical protein Pst134EA_029381 [Puccinia striiformis f. sp. tritici]|uniref:hypothetical protein n=1 Tax=Puccinia striiformis f. sp. tritici TaxID=168172 RepID=UPI002008002A|nr:hypothetical protein Pst134EA_029381 [Puccinia striiformis f. sp. tritici]KAH9441364.1 hypothetical protein Pst134EB_030032 [Puccinia striiformis f. sp. tritici]KAH9447342.1 hypothetical protein Pst134EA_029381 [Puccinia striiformis f. sp. tritici]KAI9624187.1 hypothetical protein KEM48_009085 [Puccinia striiformis f. sp. tritici PST-130]